VTARTELLHPLGCVLLLGEILEDPCLRFLKLRSRHAISRPTDSRCEGAQLSHVFLAIITHGKMEPDSELFEKAAGQILIAGDESDDFGQR